MKECGSTLFRWDWRWTLALRPARLQVSRRRNKAMSGGWLVEIVVLAMIAGFVALRLVSVLGRRTGHEQPLPQTLDRSRSEEHTSELQSLMRISYAVFCLEKKNNHSLIKLQT